MFQRDSKWERTLSGRRCDKIWLSCVLSAKTAVVAVSLFHSWLRPWAFEKSSSVQSGNRVSSSSRAGHYYARITEVFRRFFESPSLNQLWNKDTATTAVLADNTGFNARQSYLIASPTAKGTVKVVRFNKCTIYSKTDCTIWKSVKKSIRWCKKVIFTKNPL